MESPGRRSHPDVSLLITGSFDGIGAREIEHALDVLIEVGVSPETLNISSWQ